VDSKFVAQVKHQRHAGGPQLGLQALGVALLAHAAKHVQAPLRQQGSRRVPEAGRGARDDCRPRMVEHARCSGAAVELPARQLTGLWPVTAVLIWRLGDSAGGNRHLQLLIGPHMACQPKNWRWRRWLAQEGMHSAGTAQRAPSTAVQQSDELAVLQLNPGSLDWSRAEAGALQSEGGAICDNRHWHVVVGHLACPLRRPGHMKVRRCGKGSQLSELYDAEMGAPGRGNSLRVPVAACTIVEGWDGYLECGVLGCLVQTRCATACRPCFEAPVTSADP